MYNMQYQKGMGALGWVAVLALIAFLSLIALKTVPVYINAMTISSILSDMEKEPDMGSRSPSEILGTLYKRLGVNNIRDIDRDSIYLDTTKDYINLELDYEVRRTFIGNIDLVLSFNQQAEIPKQ